MKVAKAKEILISNGFWSYSEHSDLWSNGKRQLTFLNNNLYINEHYIYRRGVMKSYKISTIKQLKEFIELSKN